MRSALFAESGYAMAIDSATTGMEHQRPFWTLVLQSGLLDPQEPSARPNPAGIGSSLLFIADRLRYDPAQIPEQKQSTSTSTEAAMEDRERLGKP